MDDDKSWNQWRDEASGHFKEQRWLEASNCYTEAIRRNAADTYCYVDRAICRLYLYQLQLASEDVEKAIGFEPKTVQDYRELSRNLMKFSKFPEALMVCAQGSRLTALETKSAERQRHWEEAAKSAGPPKPGHQDVEVIDNYRDFMASNPFVTEALHCMERFPPDSETAMELLQRATEAGSAEASYPLGMMYFQGLGVDRDANKALELWKQAAAQKPYRQFGDQIKANPGVAESENAIGNAYSGGTGVEQDDAEAFKWIKRAAEHGCHQSFFALGSFLENGRGCVRDPSAARKWLDRAAENCPQGEDDNDSPGDRPPVDGPSMDGPSMDVPSTNVPLAVASPVVPTTVAPERSAVEQLDRQFAAMEIEEVKSLMKFKMEEGFPFARLYFTSLEKSSEALKLLQQQKFHESFHALRESRRLWASHVCDSRPFLAAARKLLKKDPNDHAALYIVATSAPEIDGSEQLNVMRRCLELGATIADYHHFLSKILIAQGNFQLALRYCDEALKLLQHADWLFVRAALLQHLVLDPFPLKEVIEAYQVFLTLASSDHLLVPHAYYSIGLLFCFQKEEEKALALYRKGLEVENPSVRLPCFEPLKGFPPKDMLTTYLMLRKLRCGVKMTNVVDQMCATCTRSGSLTRCGRCRKVGYCSEVCQKHNWCVHKSHCAK